MRGEIGEKMVGQLGIIARKRSLRAKASKAYSSPEHMAHRGFLRQRAAGMTKQVVRKTSSILKGIQSFGGTMPSRRRKNIEKILRY